MVSPADRRRPADVEKVSAKILIESLERLEEWIKRVEALDALPNTSLSGDDAASEFDPVSHQVRSYLIVALDHLITLKLAVVKGSSLPSMAALTLIRSAIESIGMGLWLLGPSSRDERVLRSLMLVYESRRDVHNVESELAGRTAKFPISGDRTVQRLQEVRDKRPGISGASLNAPGIGSRLANAQSLVPEQDISLLAVWRAASGIAHGGRSMIYSLLESTTIREHSHGAEVLMTSSFSVVAGFYRQTEWYMNKLVLLFDSRNAQR